MILIGVTGIVGSGKTTVSAMLRREGLEVIDLDRIAKEAIKKQRVISEITKAFGDGYAAGGEIDIKKVGQLVFRNKEARERLESIIHPVIDEEIQNRAKRLETKGTKVAIVDGPLIFEKGLDKYLHKIIVVSGKAETIKARLRKRGMDEEDSERRMAAQMPLEEKEARADYVIHNEGMIEDLEKEVGNLLRQIKQWEVELNAS